MDVTAITSPSLRATPQSGAAADPASPADKTGGYRVEALERLTNQAVAASGRADEAQPVQQQKLKVTLDIDRNTNRVVASLVDPDTGEVKQELPPEELLRSAAQLREMLDRILDIEA